MIIDLVDAVKNLLDKKQKRYNKLQKEAYTIYKQFWVARCPKMGNYYKGEAKRLQDEEKKVREKIVKIKSILHYTEGDTTDED